jgi:hypothetical protein
MGKTLLQDLTGNTETKESALTADADDNKGLSELMHEMKKQLDSAAAELMQPRQEVLDKLLKQVLH